MLGSKYPRSYYKCTVSGCPVKKYVEQYEENGKVTEKISYKGGEHNHEASKAKSDPISTKSLPMVAEPVAVSISFE